MQLFQIPFREYQDFKGQTNSGQFSMTKLSKYVTYSNKTRALLMRGLPFKVTISEIQTFFQAVQTLDKTDIIIEEFSGGKRSGSALVFFLDEDSTLKAKDGLNNATIGNRYVELFVHTDERMQ